MRDFAAAASFHGIEIAGIPNFSDFPEVVEDAPTFDGNARKKADFYSLHSNGEIVLADDSGLEVDALDGAPGVHSARYAAGPENANSSDADNKLKLLREMKYIPDDQRTARFVCVIAVAQNGKPLATFRGEAEGTILHDPRGTGGFGYDPLFFFPSLNKTFAELSAEEKSTVSHRGRAFRKFLAWAADSPASRVR